ncbi:accessory factor UbiK family protein [Uliginosibacterium aquaticum]|uniref:Ubiquinone biosynthesis accessory factor UbiK n=1 Tax=Uliginosibacterium aquaticum TaxID=2731212 RepID=A0ABX2INR2_9RHOO|nr:accessory factor UbiK family protein [Uliginosibacterium aquaticum]NSL55755.1 accessory factor UbiK family protein [Uliginosibacterium aquaticum]
MIDPSKPAQIFEEMGNKFSELMQSGPAKDFEKNAKAMLAAGFSRLDLVTREEFEVQKALLEAACARIEALEKRLAERDSQSPA